MRPNFLSPFEGWRGGHEGYEAVGMRCGPAARNGVDDDETEDRSDPELPQH